MRFGSVLVLKDEIELAQEAGSRLPVEDATVEAGADGEGAAFAVDQLVAADCVEWKFEEGELFEFD